MAKHQALKKEPDANSALAYEFWLARCFRDGSPEEDLLRAVCVNSIKSGVKSSSLSPPNRVMRSLKSPGRG